MDDKKLEAKVTCHVWKSFAPGNLGMMPTQCLASRAKYDAKVN